MDTSSATAQDHLLKPIEDEAKVSEQVSQELKYRRNALAPISRLPTETLAEIFSLYPGHERAPYLQWIRVTHVCHRWREIALNSPYLWSHINFSKLTLAGLTEILARAKKSPLHFEAKTDCWSMERFKAFGRLLDAHISRIRHIGISGKFQTALGQLVSPAPALLSLSLSEKYSYRSSLSIPDSLFNGTAPQLTRLELLGYSIEWKSPLLKGLQTLKILSPYADEMPTLGDWLAALSKMSQLKTLILEYATPTISDDDPLISEPQRTVTLPSLTHFSITALATDCALALEHLVLPALISLHVTSECESSDGDDVQLLIPHVTRNAHGPQDTAPLQTILFNGNPTDAQIVAWTVPDADAEVWNLVTLKKASASARLVFSAFPNGGWRKGTCPLIFHAVLSRLPLNAISTLSAHNRIRLSKEVWLSHAPRLTMLKRVLLVPTAVKAFTEMLREDVPPNSLPRLPQLTKLILPKVPLTVPMAYRLRDMLVKRKERGAPLEDLDLRTCIGTEGGIQSLAATVCNVQRPAHCYNGWRRFEGERTDDYYYGDGAAPWDAYPDEGDEEDDDDEFDDTDDWYYSDKYFDHP